MILPIHSPRRLSGILGLGAVATLATTGVTPPAIAQTTNPAAPVADPLVEPAAADSNLTVAEITNLTELSPQTNTNALDSFAEPMGQVNSVSQLSDVRPTDWAYQALQSLVERYGCIAGYPDGTFRGNRALTRYEFAAGLNACLDNVLELVGGGLDDGDLATLRELQEEFAAELAILRGRVDSLEARVGDLEANQFSTTTKLFGQVVMGIQGRNDTEYDFFLNTFDDNSEINVITNAQLTLYSQLAPRSLLIAGLQAGDGNTGGGGLSNYVGLSYEGDNDHDFELSDLSFRQLIGDDFALIAGPRGVNAVNVFRGANRVESAGSGPLSRFAQRNPIIAIGSGTGGVGFDWQVGDRLSLQGVYSTSNPSDVDIGLFGGDDGVTNLGAQLVITPVDEIDIAFQYVNSYSPYGRLFTGVGDDLVALPTGQDVRAPISTNAFGTSLEWRITPGISAGGWFGFTTSDLKAFGDGTVETTNWMAYLNFPDLGGEGNLGGLYFGQPTRITRSDLTDGFNVPDFINDGDITASTGDQPGTTYHLEAFYRYRLNDNIAITPGVITVFNPNQNDDNDTVVIGALRTTFSF